MICSLLFCIHRLRPGVLQYNCDESGSSRQRSSAIRSVGVSQHKAEKGIRQHPRSDSSNRQTDIRVCCSAEICEVNAFQQGFPSFKTNPLFVSLGREMAELALQAK